MFCFSCLDKELLTILLKPVGKYIAFLSVHLDRTAKFVAKIIAFLAKNNTVQLWICLESWVKTQI